jgi:glycosyltransferase involved in cell wall biosynthesis
MTSENPLVSVIIPTYNRAYLIGETIQSVLNQSYSNWELIVVDDGSTDNSDQVIKKFGDARIEYHIIEHSGAFGVVRNYGIKQSKGDLIAFLDSDDVWHHKKLERQVDFFSSFTESMFIFTHVEFFGKETRQLPDYPSIVSEKLFDRYLEERYFSFYPSSLIFRKSTLSTIGLMDESLPAGADTQFFATLCLTFKGSFMQDRLVSIRKHAGNTSAGNLLFGYPESITIVTSLYQQRQLRRKSFVRFISKIYYKMGLLLRQDAQYASSVRCFLRYCRLRPLHWKGWARILQVSWQGLTTLLKRGTRLLQD